MNNKQLSVYVYWSILLVTGAVFLIVFHGLTDLSDEPVPPMGVSLLFLVPYLLYMGTAVPLVYNEASRRGMDARPWIFLSSFAPAVPAIFLVLGMRSGNRFSLKPYNFTWR
ncbi:MAG: hypothetical protein GY765_35150 [bacterium]|nr:hypothetical protein [bacterium]